MIRGRWIIKSTMVLTGILVLSLFALSAGPISFAQGPKEIIIGGTISKTGRFAGEVAPFDKLAYNWAKVINEAGGIFMKEYGRRLPLRFVYYDDRSDSETAVKLYERLVTLDKVHLLIGPYSSPLTIRVSTVAEKYKIPMITAEANSDKIFQRGFKWIFGVIDSGMVWSNHYFDMIKKEGKAKTMALIIQDHPHALDVGLGARKDAKRIGLKLVFDKIYSPKITDFSAAITAIKSLNPDILFISSYPAFGINFMKQAKELGLRPREFHLIHAVKAATDALGMDAEYITGEHFWAEGLTMGDVATYKKILAMTGISHLDFPWSAIRMQAYDALKAALESAGSVDRDKLRGALAGLKYETLCGTNSFNAKGQGRCNTWTQQYLNGRFWTIWPAEVAQKKHVYPTPWDKR